MKISFTREEISDLLMACTVCEFLSSMQDKKYAKLHDKLKAKRDEYDKVLRIIEDLEV